MRSTWLPLLVAGILATLPACGKTPPAPVNPSLPAMVEVQNQAFNDMNIYVMRGGTRARLGTVTGNTTKVFEIPRNMVGEGTPIRFQADPIGGSRTPFTQEVVVLPGETVVLRIPPG